MRPIYANNIELIKNKKATYLSDEISAASLTLTVDSIIGFAVNQILMIVEPGNETAEIVKTHTATSPSGNTITLAAATKFSHPQGTKIYIINWDQIEFSWGIGIVSTVVLDTIDIQPDQVETQYSDTVYSSGNYFIRFKNSISGAYSNYSDSIPWEGYGENTVGSIINYALKRNKLQDFTDNVDHDFCIQEINACLKFIRGKLKKWHSLQSFDYSLGTTSLGLNKFALADDMWQYSNKSILALRVGSGLPLTYKDKREWALEMEGVNHTTISAGASVGAVTLTLTDSNNFDDSGTVMIKGQEITYTAVDRSTHVISGIPASGTGSITATLTAADDVWQGAYELGNPDRFTIVEGYVLIWPIPYSTYLYKNVTADYWKEAPSIDSDADEIDIMRFDMVKYWLTWAIRGQLKNDGMRDVTDGDYIMFTDILKDAITLELRVSGQKHRTQPRLNHIVF
jgi:hypothetical protein